MVFGAGLSLIGACHEDEVGEIEGLAKVDHSTFGHTSISIRRRFRDVVEVDASDVVKVKQLSVRCFRSGVSMYWFQMSKSTVDWSSIVSMSAGLVGDKLLCGLFDTARQIPIGRCRMAASWDRVICRGSFTLPEPFRNRRSAFACRFLATFAGQERIREDTSDATSMTSLGCDGRPLTSLASPRCIRC